MAKIAINNTWFHGSQYCGIQFDKHMITYFTKDYKAALAYARGIICTGKSRENKPRNPTIYTVKIALSQVFDFRLPEHQALYKEWRVRHNKWRPKFGQIEELLPDINALVTADTGLPGYGITEVVKELGGDKFDGMWIDEGPHGVSLALFDPPGAVTVLYEEVL